MDQNFTPIPNSLANIPEFNTSSTQSAPIKKKRFGLEDIYLVVSASIFILSIGVLMQSQNFTASSDAKMRRTIDIQPKKVQISKDYPKKYKDETIAETIYTSAEKTPGLPAENKEAYIKKQVMKFYAYKDTLAQNQSSPNKELVPVSFQDIEDGVKVFEPLLLENVISKGFFGYIQIKFSGMADEQKLKEQYGDLNEKAKNIIKKYQQMFVLGEFSPQQIIDISNRDEEILTLNDREKNAFIDSYDATKNPFEDDGFNTFLFSQQVNQISDPYQLTKDNTPYAYVIVYPSKLSKKEFSSLEEILKEKENNFGY